MQQHHRLLMMAALTMGLAPTLQAQEEMKEVWQQSPDHKIQTVGVGRWADGYNYSASEKTITMHDNKSGAIKWTKAFSDIAPKVNKVDDIIPMWNAGVLVLCDRRMGKDQLVGVAVEDGRLLWQTDAYQGVSEETIEYLDQSKLFLIATDRTLAALDSKTGELKWETAKMKGAAGLITEKADGHVVVLNYKPTGIAALFNGFKNQLMKIDLKTGEVAWEATYRGAFEKKVITKEAIGSMTVTDQEVVLMINGMQVYDYKTGAVKWAAAYDQTPAQVRKPAMQGVKKFGAYGTVAEPVVDGEFVYVLDVQNRKKQYIKKYNRQNGQLVWTSEEIQDAKVIPGMFVHKDRVILQVGGTIELQYYYEKRQPDGDVEKGWVVDFDEYGPYNLQGFDVTTGKSVWQSDKLKKGLANAFMNGDNIVAASGKALYCMDYATGKEKYEVSLGKDNISTCNYITAYKDKVVVVGEKGLSMHNVSDGSMVSAARYKRAVPVRHESTRSFVSGNSLALRNADGDYAVYNLDAGTYKKYDGRKNAMAYLSTDGDALYVFESGNVMRKSKVTRFATYN